MRNFRLLLILTTCSALLFNLVGIGDSIMLVAATILACAYTRKNSWHHNYAKYIVFLVVWISVIFMPSFHLIWNINSEYITISPFWNNRILSFGIPIYLFTSSLFLILSRRDYSTVLGSTFNAHIVSKSTLRIFMVFCVILTAFCYAIGLGRMGEEAVVLPFHLGGIINLFRNVAVPILFAIIIEGYLINKKSIPISVWIGFILWSVLEIFAWMSKSVLVMHLQPALILLYIYYKPSLSKAVRMIAPLIVVFLFMYPIIETMRHNDSSSSSITESFSAARKETSNLNMAETLLTPLNRTFMFGSQFAQDYSYINTNEVFDFSKSPVLYMVGGSAMYQTFVIDGYPPTAHHSSGTNGLMDPLLHGGVGLMYIVLFLIVLLSFYADKLFQKGYTSIGVIMILQLLIYTRNANISTFYDSTGIQTLFVHLICIYVAFRLNFKYRKAI